MVMRPRDNTALLVHQIKKQPAKVWRTDLGLAPSHAPELDAAPADAVAEIRRMKSNPPPAGPATLKGKWAGLLFCTDGTPSIVLERRVASYGTLKLTSKADGRWLATFVRAEKWFSKAKQESIERSGLQFRQRCRAAFKGRKELQEVRYLRDGELCCAAGGWIFQADKNEPEHAGAVEYIDGVNGA